MEKMLEKMNIDEAKDYLLEYLSVVNKEESKVMKEFLDTLEYDELESLLCDIVKNGIPIHQAPFWNNQNILSLKRIYEFTGLGRSKFEGIFSSLVFGEKYMMLLKHLPKGKFSARSLDQLSIKNLPVKSSLHKEYKAHYSSTPIKLGEMEIIGMDLANSADKGGMLKVKRFTDAYANNEEDRMRMLEAMLTDNPYSFDFESSGTRSENSKVIRAFLLCAGAELE